MVHTEFIEGERVLCYHGPLLYEAKILKISNDAPEALETNPGSEPPFYFVHYKGWKQSWDEWITNTRLLKLTTENIAAQKQLKEVQKQRDAAEQQALQAAQRGGEAKPSIPGKRGPVVDSRGTKRGRESTAQMGISDQRRALERGYPEDYIRPQIYIAIPDTLKVRLVDDWEWITHRKQVVPLPRKPNVRDILAKYRRSLIDDKNPLHNPHTAQRPVNLTHEFLAGLQLYFDKSLGTNLLYKFERLQYSNQKQITSGPGSGDVAKEEEKSIYQLHAIDRADRWGERNKEEEGELNKKCGRFTTFSRVGFPFTESKWRTRYDTIQGSSVDSNSYRVISIEGFRF
ncbi:MRG-domain-containing protein [Atractiella rhizophila]|nr:MRG-domain-containing protein [Atractiella rhizophila]